MPDINPITEESYCFKISNSRIKTNTFLAPNLFKMNINNNEKIDGYTQPINRIGSDMTYFRVPNIGDVDIVDKITGEINTKSGIVGYNYYLSYINDNLEKVNKLLARTTIKKELVDVTLKDKRKIQVMHTFEGEEPDYVDEEELSSTTGNSHLVSFLVDGVVERLTFYVDDGDSLGFVRMPKNPIKDDVGGVKYEFVGWVIDGEDDHPFTNETIVDRDLTIKPVWEEYYSVRFDMNKTFPRIGSIPSSIDSIYVKNGSELTTLIDPYYYYSKLSPKRDLILDDFETNMNEWHYVDSGTGGWSVGDALSHGVGGKSAYISEDGGLTAGGGSSSNAHMYIDVDFPLFNADGDVVLRFMICGICGRYYYGHGLVVSMLEIDDPLTTNIVPDVLTRIASGINSSTDWWLGRDMWKEVIINIPARYSNKKMRLVFTCNNPYGFESKSMAIDDISIIKGDLYERLPYYLFKEWIDCSDNSPVSKTSVISKPTNIKAIIEKAFPDECKVSFDISSFAPTCHIEPTYVFRGEKYNNYPGNSNIIIPRSTSLIHSLFDKVNGSYINKWVVNGSEAYISSNGVDNIYNKNSYSIVHICQKVQFPYFSNVGHLTFEWKCFGESGYDYGQVFLASGEDVYPTAGVMNSRWDSLSILHSSSKWETATVNIPLKYSGVSGLLIFTFRCDNSVGSDPPFAIRNITSDMNIFHEPVDYGGRHIVGWEDSEGNPYTPSTIIEDSVVLYPILSTEESGALIGRPTDTDTDTDTDTIRLFMIKKETYKSKMMPDGKIWMIEDYRYMLDFDSARRAAPDGWHLPTVSEWSSLISLCCAANGYTVSRYWLKLLTSNKYGGTDMYGFSAELKGYLPRIANTGNDEGALLKDIVGYWWTTDVFKEHDQNGHLLPIERCRAFKIDLSTASSTSPIIDSFVLMDKTFNLPVRYVMDY